LASNSNITLPFIQSTHCDNVGAASGTVEMLGKGFTSQQDRATEIVIFNASIIAGMTNVTDSNIYNMR